MKASLSSLLLPHTTSLHKAFVSNFGSSPSSNSETGDPHLHNLPLEASWAAKYAGLSSKDAINLVSRNIEQILGLDVKEETRDFVVFEGDPLQFGSSVVLAFDGQQGDVSLCWPESN